MSRLRIGDLNSAGSELFQDSETFLLDLKDDEILMHHGGIFITTNISVINVPISEDIFAPSISFIR
ncbi:hypothetical protein HCG51_10410 [Tolypothrix sp. PCC 7910]|uniref:hypothetical protein n=1 Tax=Tolypothrix sp. PCC 7910 TaxID=2099387 RepID=UPI000D20806B|nr:hypothetical protein [Tolypothrix sp. PCC 7910]AVH79441.1 hypothetical protein [Tolypothrix sp. PCC 7910]QIR35272.1 hypothetical protein HCG51_10410 [Tolypothrix sp. PCC 7910]